MQAVESETKVVDYRVLRDQVGRAGLLDRRTGYYRAKIALSFSGYVLAWIAFILVGNSWYTLFCALGLAALTTQIVFIGHDAGHNQISTSRRVNRWIGLAAGNLLSGVSFGWWVPKHNAHHLHPNQIGGDPDIGPGSLAFTFTGEEAGARRGLSRRIARWQAWLFLPMLMAEGVGLHITSADHLLRRHDRTAFVEGLLLAAHAASYLTLAFVFLSPVRALVFMAINQGVLGLYLGLSFAPNHKGMPVLPADSQLPFATRQILTARTVSGGRIIHFVLGGLNHQIEHHLFPTMPRPNLMKAQTMVRAFCSENDLPYAEATLIESYRMSVHHLAAVARSAGPITRAAGN